MFCKFQKNDVESVYQLEAMMPMFYKNIHIALGVSYDFQILYIEI